MFKKNTRHQQPALISAASELAEKQRKRLENSWAGTFYKEFFCRIEEEIFANLYSDVASRPNVPVNVLVGLEALKAGYGWSDQELYEHYCYDLQVRYALGYDRLGDGDFEIRTLYYFRERLSKYNVEKGINLLEKAFEKITDAQITDLKVRTGMQRMDSTQIASNIVSASRLQLLVECVQRVERILSESDKERLRETFEPYIRDSAGHYTYRIKGKEAIQEHLQIIGQSMYTLMQELEAAYAQETAYQVMQRLFTDHFHCVEGKSKPKENNELTSDCLQSVDDMEATYRTKGGGHYKGYVANISETCHPENELQLITKVQVAPNNIEDTQLLEEAIPNLKERTNLETLFTDGGYGSPEIDKTLFENQIEQIQTAIRGRIPSKEKFNLSNFEIKQTETGKPTQVICPQGQIVEVHPGNQKKGYVAHFEDENCSTCPYRHNCPVQKGKRDTRWHLRFTQEQANVSQRRRRNMAYQKEGQNFRSAVEATVRQVKHPFPASKLPVRGQFRVTCMMLASSLMSNVRRIHCYLEAKTKQEINEKMAHQVLEGSKDDISDSCFAFLKSISSAKLLAFSFQRYCFSC